MTQSAARTADVAVRAPTGGRQGDSLPGRREATKQANRAAILDAAREVFADLGYGAASVRYIVRGTDLATGTFYNYFADKEEVFRTLLEESVVEARALALDVQLVRALGGGFHSA